MRAPQTQMEPPEQLLRTSYRDVWEREALLLLGLQRMGDELEVLAGCFLTAMK